MSASKRNLINSSSLAVKEPYRAKYEAIKDQIIVHPSTIGLTPVRCPVCKHLLGFVDGKAQIKCHKCKHTHYEETRVTPMTDS